MLWRRTRQVSVGTAESREAPEALQVCGSCGGLLGGHVPTSTRGGVTGVALKGCTRAHPVVRLSVWKHWRGVRGTTGTAPCGNAVLHAGNTSTFLGRSELAAVVSGGAVGKRSSCGNLPTRSWGLLLRLLLQR